MKKVLAVPVGLLFLGAVFLMSKPVSAGTAQEDLGQVNQNTASFDGGPGSTLNTSPDAAVDLSDVDTSKPVNSPSLQNQTPAGKAPGKAVNSEEDSDEEEE